MLRIGIGGELQAVLLTVMNLQVLGTYQNGTKLDWT
jgi:hypothetical protein